jgi:NADH dehydrogenase/NADH:ubiquinone oxidoreductase subunit G
VSKTSAEKIGAIAGDLAAVEEMYALKLLMASLGSPNVDCRQDGAALDPAFGRASYLFNPTIEGIEQADALLIIGCQPALRGGSVLMPASASAGGWATSRSASSATSATRAMTMSASAPARRR